MLKFILIGLAAVIVIFLIVAAFQPADFRVTRSATIAAPPEAIFAQINNLHQWNQWSPFAKLDPNMKNTFSGPPEGVGASQAWVGNSQAGEGRMTIVESAPNERIAMKLEFIKPFAGTNAVEFTLKPEGNQTTVSWSMAGEKNFMAKAMGLFMDCDKMCGGMFEEGLANLRAVVERPAASPVTAL